ncbi:MAG: PIG-L family deacetylase, partial [bacterium]
MPEAEKAASLLTCNLSIENLKDRYISEGAETIAVIEKYVKKIQPDMVFVPSMHDIHQDHRAVHKAAMVAVRLVKEIFVYKSPSTTYDFKPNYYVDITKYINKKVEAVKIHSS